MSSLEQHLEQRAPRRQSLKVRELGDAQSVCSSDNLSQSMRSMGGGGVSLKGGSVIGGSLRGQRGRHSRRSLVYSAPSHRFQTSLPLKDLHCDNSTASLTDDEMSLHTTLSHSFCPDGSVSALMNIGEEELANLELENNNHQQEQQRFLEMEEPSEESTTSLEQELQLVKNSSDNTVIVEQDLLTQMSEAWQAQTEALVQETVSELAKNVDAIQEHTDRWSRNVDYLFRSIWGEER